MSASPSTALAIYTGLRAVVPITDASSRAEAYAQQAKSQATRKAYRSDWDHFESWCAWSGLSSLPAKPVTVSLYIAALADTHKPATLGRRLAAIAARHKALGYESPASMRNRAVSSVWRGIKRTHGVAQETKAPVLVENLRAMVGNLRPGLIGIRDRALLLVGFAGAFRRSELMALYAADVQFTSDGLVVTLRRSKTDQEGESRKVGIPCGSNPDTCPVRRAENLDGSGSYRDRPAVFNNLVSRSHGRAHDRATLRRAWSKSMPALWGSRPLATPVIRSGLAWRPQPPSRAPASGPL